MSTTQDIGDAEIRNTVCFQGAHSLVKDTSPVKLRLSWSHAMDAPRGLSKALEERMRELQSLCLPGRRRVVQAEKKQLM